MMTTNATVSTAAAAFRASREPPRPFSTALAAAITAAEAAEKAWQNCDCSDCQESTGTPCALYVAWCETDYAVDTARAALAASDEPRPFLVREESGAEATVEATSESDALEQAADWVRGGSYPEEGRPFHVDYYVRDLALVLDGRGASTDWSSGTVTIEATEPKCTQDGGHDWQSPHSIVGGDKSNPGVWGGPNGGVSIDECCMRCGCKRHTVTRAQRRDTGATVGNESTYEASAYADEIAALSEVA